MTHDCDIVIVGGGITGVALAHALAPRTRRSVVLLDKEPGVARHTSGRNSGVIHGGYNQKPGTQKARFCVAGNRALKQFCNAHQVAWRPTGLLVVARTDAEAEMLPELHRRGTENGVPDLALLDGPQLAREEPNAVGVGALLATSVACVDGAGVAAALRQVSAEAGVAYRFECKVKAVDPGSQGVVLHTNQGLIRAGYLVNCAGLYADRIAHAFGAGQGFRLVPFRGEYYAVRESKKDWVRRMVYPVPNLEFPFLGIHWTPIVTGGLKVGPNVVLAMGREAYTTWSLHPGETWEILSGSAFWRMFRKHPEFRRFAWHFLKTVLSKTAFMEEAQTLVKGLGPQDLERGPPAGNRAQLVANDGTLVDDLRVETLGPSLHVLNVVSPGLTCALPLGAHLADRVVEAVG